MTHTIEPFVRDPFAGEAHTVLGVTHVYKATGIETGGSFSLWETIVPPGAGAPPHTHAHEDEAFYMLGGELLIDFEGEPAPRSVATGSFFFGARQRRHAFRNVSNQVARVLVLSAPSYGLDRMFAELEAATAAGVRDIEPLAAITAKYGVTIEPPAS